MKTTLNAYKCFKNIFHVMVVFLGLITIIASGGGDGGGGSTGNGSSGNDEEVNTAIMSGTSFATAKPATTYSVNSPEVSSL